MRFAAHGSQLGDPRTARGAGVRPPVVHVDHARLDQLQAVEVASELLGGAGPVRDGAGCLVHPQRLLQRRAGVDAVVDRQVAAGRQAAEQPGHDRPRFLVVDDVAEDPHERERDRLAQVQPLRRLAQHRAGVVHISVDVAGAALRTTGQQRPGVRQYQRVVIDVHDPGLRRGALRDLMGVGRGRQARAHVQELADPGLVGHVQDDPSQERPVGQGDIHDPRVDCAELIAGHPVDLVVVLAAEPVVPDPGRVRHRGVDRGPGGLALRRGMLVSHGNPSGLGLDLTFP